MELHKSAPEKRRLSGKGPFWVFLGPFGVLLDPFWAFLGLLLGGLLAKVPLNKGAFPLLPTVETTRLKPQEFLGPLSAPDKRHPSEIGPSRFLSKLWTSVQTGAYFLLPKEAGTCLGACARTDRLGALELIGGASLIVNVSSTSYTRITSRRLRW